MRRTVIGLVIVIVAPRAAAAQERLAVLAGYTELTAGGGGVMVRWPGVAIPLGVQGQVGPRGAGLGLDVSWVRPRDRGRRIEVRVFAGAGIGYRFGDRAPGEKWGDVVAVGGFRIPYAGNHGPVFDIGLGIARTIGGDDGSGNFLGLTGRILLGWAF